MPYRPTRPLRRLRAGTLLLALASAGCGETTRVVAPEKALHDPVGSTRMEGLREVARSPDRRHVPALIEMLDDEDPGIRLIAGATLQRVTGRDTGYRAHAGPAERREQLLAWRRWWDAEQGRPSAAGGAPPAPSSAPSPGAAPPPPPPRAGEGAR